MASKYLIQFRGRHVFNPSNFALVLALPDPRQRAGWSRSSSGGARSRRRSLIVLLVIVAGRARRAVPGRPARGRGDLLGHVRERRSAILALSGHAFTANWHLGPGRRRLLLEGARHSRRRCSSSSSFMITDPRTAPETRAGPADLLGRDRPARRAADRADADRVLGEGGAARRRSRSSAPPARSCILAREALERRAPRVPAGRAGRPRRRRSQRGCLAVAGVAVFAAC